MGLQVDLLRSSFELVAPQADRLSERFYERLFADYPQLKPLFAGVDIPEQRRKLIQSLAVIVKSLDDSDTLTRFLHELGSRHADYGVAAEDYEPVALTLMAVLAEIAGEAWSDELAAAWGEALEAVATIMLEGVDQKTTKQEPMLVGSPAGAEKRSESNSSSVNGDSPASNTRATIAGAPAQHEERNMSINTANRSNGIESKQQIENLEKFYNMVENVPINVLLADVDLKLIYMNAASTSTLRSLEQYLPKPISELVGQSIDIFHKDPSHQRRLLSNPDNLPHTAQIQVGPETLSLVISAVRDGSNNYIGPMVTWEVVTEKLKMEREAARLESMVSQMPTNVIMADKDLRITYANPASIKQLTALQQFLPVPVSELVGQNIDVFHKNPSYQRGMLANPDNLPHQAQIQVGPETLDLLVSAVKDADGNYLGPMVTWEVVTERLRTENEMVRVQNMMDNIPINVMMSNLDFEIVYMNPASTKTLKEIEHLLPTTVDKIIGQKVDIFHKNPEVQRRILSDPANLPHRAKISLGEETLDLLVSAIVDKDGKFIGPMVTWEVITAQVELANEFEREVKGVVQVVTSSATEMQASSKSMAATTEETSRQAQVVAAASEEATKNVETVSSAAEELSASISEIANHVQEASRMTSQAVEEADRTNVTINDLGESSNEIGQVVKVITSIAQQTNLLALNATIEAARAGEAGKGFAVVANEVKELARQTAKATEEISQKIAAIQSATGGAATAIESIGERIGKINEIATTIAGAVEEQTAATNEISRNVAEAAKGTSEVSSNISSVSQAADEGGRGAADILAAADSLAQESTRLDETADQFLEKLRAV